MGGLDTVGRRVFVVANGQPVFELRTRLHPLFGQVDGEVPLEPASRRQLLHQVRRVERLPPLADGDDRVLHAEVVGGGRQQRDLHVARDGNLGLVWLEERDLRRRFVLVGHDVINDRFRVQLAARRLELDRIRARFLDDDLAQQELRVVPVHFEPAGVAVLRVFAPCEIEMREHGGLIRPGANRDLGPLDRLNVPSRDVRSRADPGILGELIINRDRRDHRRGENVEVVLERLGVASGQVVIHPLADVAEDRGPGVVIVLAGGEVDRRVVFAAVHAVMQLDLLGAGVQDLDRERYVGAGDDPGKLGMVARLNVRQPGVRGTDDVGEQGAPGRVEAALRGQRGVNAKKDDHARERISHLQDPALVDDSIHLDLRQVLDRLRLDRREERPGDTFRVLIQGQIVDQAVLEGRVRLFNRLRRVQRVDPSQHRQDDPQHRERRRARQPQVKDDPPEPEREAKKMVENHFRKQKRQR